MPGTSSGVRNIERSTLMSGRQAISSRLFAESPDPDALAQLPPTSKAGEEGVVLDSKDDIISSISDQSSSASGTTTLFINQQTKRVLIEELGYKRVEVDRLKPELALPIVSKRLSRPQDGVPDDWLLREDETASAMMAKLEKEQQYPLKFPLLGVSLILFGKGLSDALITAIKVYIGFPGANLLVKETFMGLPVLGIDFVCVVIGAALGFWTLNTMKD